MSMDRPRILRLLASLDEQGLFPLLERLDRQPVAGGGGGEKRDTNVWQILDALTKIDLREAGEKRDTNVWQILGKLIEHKAWPVVLKPFVLSQNGHDGSQDHWTILACLSRSNPETFQRVEELVC